MGIGITNIKDIGFIYAIIFQKSSIRNFQLSAFNPIACFIGNRHLIFINSKEINKFIFCII